MNQEQGNGASSTARETATLGGGCFWCLDAVYVQLEGVESVVSGYSGGSVANPSYEAVCTGRTGHAEVVQVTYDPRVVTYKEILTIFFTIHDPTTLNRQGADVGTQYRSVIYYHDQEQKETAAALISELNDADIWSNPIVTEVSPLEIFYPGEDYHQDYYKNNSRQPYCAAVISPKVAKFRKAYASRLKSR